MKICREHKFPELYSAIYVRYALLHRFLGNPDNEILNKELIEYAVQKNHIKTDSAFYYSNNALRFAKRYNREYDSNEAYLTLGIMEAEQNKNYEKSIRYVEKTIPFWKRTNNLVFVASMYYNIAMSKKKQKDYKPALKYKYIN